MFILSRLDSVPPESFQNQIRELVIHNVGELSSVATVSYTHLDVYKRQPFVVVMVLLCLALYRDLRKDPMMLRHLRGNELIEKAVLYGAVKHGEEFYIVVQEKKASVKVATAPSEVSET